MGMHLIGVTPTRGQVNTKRRPADQSPTRSYVIGVQWYDGEKDAKGDQHYPSTND